MKVQDGEAYDAYIDGLKRSEVNRMLKPLAKTVARVQERKKEEEVPPPKAVQYGFPLIRGFMLVIAYMFYIPCWVIVWTVILLIRLSKFVWKGLRKSNQNI